MTLTGLHLWTVDDYHRMIEKEILTDEDKVELLEGLIIEMSPQQPPHSATVSRASDYIRKLLAGKASIRVQLPVTLRPNSEPEPDIAVVRIDERDYIDGHPTPEDIFLLVEVADWTLNKDRNNKARTYAKAKIPEYWVLDVNQQQVYVFSSPRDEGYQQELIFDRNQVVSLVSFPDIQVEIGKLFVL